MGQALWRMQLTLTLVGQAGPLEAAVLEAAVLEEWKAVAPDQALEWQALAYQVLHILLSLHVRLNPWLFSFS